MLPTDAVISTPAVIALLLDAEGITEWDPLMEGVRFALGQRATDATPDKITELICHVIENGYGRADLSNIEWGLLMDALHDAMEPIVEGSDLEFR